MRAVRPSKPSPLINRVEVRRIDLQGPYNTEMSRFVMEHLPRAAAVYDVRPLEYAEAKQWLQKEDPVSVIRTTEMIAAVKAALGITLSQSDASVALQSVLAVPCCSVLAA